MKLQALRERSQVLATFLLGLGLAVAVTMDGQLPTEATRALFVTLLGLDVVMIRWLLRLNGV